VFGIFCSWNCAKSYIQQSYSSESSEQLMWMRIMAKQVFGTTLKQFHAAPPRIFLKMFGGNLTIEEFRHTSTVSNTVAITPPLVSYPIVHQETKDLTLVEDEGTSRSPSALQSSLNPSMLAGRVVGLRRPISCAGGKGRRPSEKPSGASSEGRGGMYSEFVKKKEGGELDPPEDGGDGGGAGSGSSGGGRAPHQKQQASADLPRGKGTLASFIRNRAS